MHLIDPLTGEAAGAAEDPPRSRIYLPPGEVHAAAAPCVVGTILGSCVAVCLWDPLAGVGGVTHYLLPEGPEADPPSTRYGDVAVTVLLERLLALGTTERRLKAKIFGGASVVRSFQSGGDHVGDRNVRLAHTLLAALAIPLVAEDVGGERGRRLLFRVGDGDAWVRMI